MEWFNQAAAKSRKNVSNKKKKDMKHNFNSMLKEYLDKQNFNSVLKVYINKRVD